MTSDALPGSAPPLALMWAARVTSVEVTTAAWEADPARADPGRVAGCGAVTDVVTSTTAATARLRLRPRR